MEDEDIIREYWQNMGRDLATHEWVAIMNFNGDGNSTRYCNVKPEEILALEELKVRVAGDDAASQAFDFTEFLRNWPEPTGNIFDEVSSRRETAGGSQAWIGMSATCQKADVSVRLLSSDTKVRVSIP